MNFWQQLQKPIIAVAPMADVTDAPFRRMIAKYSNWPQQESAVMWTEFLAADGLMRAAPEGKVKLMADLKYSEEERPVVAQLFTSNEEHMEQAAALCRELGFDGIDINMGCPDRTIEKQGCGSAMIKTPEVAQKIIQAAKRGAGAVPVSVKTRIGYNHDEIDEWIPVLLKEKPAALTVHLRTRKQMSKVPADWEQLKRVVTLRDQLSPETIILGNGDVLSFEDAREKAELFRADGVMVGRALFGNPWFFHPTKRLPIRLTALPTHGVNRETIIEQDITDESIEYITLKERLQVLVEHSKLFVELLPFKNFAVMKKHYKAYVNGFPGAAELRGELMSANSPREVEIIVEKFIEQL
jgi:tRNA-dihydrouridine synthase